MRKRPASPHAFPSAAKRLSLPPLLYIQSPVVPHEAAGEPVQTDAAAHDPLLLLSDAAACAAAAHVASSSADVYCEQHGCVPRRFATARGPAPACSDTFCAECVATLRLGVDGDVEESDADDAARRSPRSRRGGGGGGGAPRHLASEEPERGSSCGLTDTPSQPSQQEEEEEEEEEEALCCRGEGGAAAAAAAATRVVAPHHTRLARSISEALRAGETPHAAGLAQVSAYQRGRVTRSMRCKLVDWFVNLCWYYACGPPTLYLTTSLLDRYLLARRGLDVRNLQTAGAACFFLACKFEEHCPPSASKIAVEACCCRAVLLSAEQDILTRLDYNLTAPTAWEFLAPAVAAEPDERVRSAARYLSEQALVCPALDGAAPSLQAAVALSCARRSVLGGEEEWGRAQGRRWAGVGRWWWGPEQVSATGYDAEGLEEAEEALVQFMVHVVCLGGTSTCALTHAHARTGPFQQASRIPEQVLSGCPSRNYAAVRRPCSRSPLCPALRARLKLTRDRCCALCFVIFCCCD